MDKLAKSKQMIDNLYHNMELEGPIATPSVHDNRKLLDIIKLQRDIIVDLNKRLQKLENTKHNYIPV